MTTQAVTRNAVLRVIYSMSTRLITAAASIAALTMLTITGCAAAHSTPGASSSQPPASPAVSTPPTVASAAAAASKRVCAELLHIWQHGPGGRLLNKVQDDIGVLAKARTVAQAQAPARILAADAQAGLAHLPPACIPGEAAAMAASFRDYSATATDVEAGNLTAAKAQVKAAEAWLLRGARDQVHWATRT